MPKRRLTRGRRCFGRILGSIGGRRWRLIIWLRSILRGGWRTNTGRLGLGGYGGAGACLASAFGCAVEVEMREFISFIIGAVFVAWLLLGYCFGLLPRLLVLPNRSAFLILFLNHLLLGYERTCTCNFINHTKLQNRTFLNSHEEAFLSLLWFHICPLHDWIYTCHSDPLRRRWTFQRQ